MFQIFSLHPWIEHYSSKSLLKENAAHLHRYHKKKPNTILHVKQNNKRLQSSASVTVLTVWYPTGKLLQSRHEFGSTINFSTLGALTQKGALTKKYHITQTETETTAF